MAIIKPSEAFPSADWASGDVRSYMKDQTPIAVDTVADVNDNDFEQARWIFVKANGGTYRLNLASVAADDGDTVLHDNVGRRYQKIVVTGAGSPWDVQVSELSDRDAFDDEPEGFAVLVSDVGDGRAAVYTMGDGGSADWSDPAYLTGADGPAGASGGGFLYTFSTTTTDSDPGAGLLRANHGTFASITLLFIDNTEANSVNISAWLDSLDDLGASANRGVLRIDAAGDPTTFRTFQITGTVVDGTGYRKVTVTPLLTAGTWTNGLSISLSFSPAGLTGAAGSTGPAGADPGVLLTWDTGTTDADPGAGEIRANNASLASATFLYVSKTSRGGSDISAFLATLDDSTNTVKGQIVLTDPASEAQAIVNVTTLTDATGYVKVGIATHSGATSFSAALAVSFQFARAGDAGAGAVSSVDGATGAVTIGAVIAAATGKATPVDADTMALSDSAASNATKKVTWANIKATLKTYFDTLYQPLLATLTSWGAITRASGFDTFVASPTWTNFLSMVTGEPTFYTAGGTDVALADGGTGASLTDPNADRIYFWDDSAGTTAWLVPGTGIAITGTSLDLDADLQSWAGVTRASGFDTWAAAPSSANLRGLLTDETGTGAAVFNDAPTIINPVLTGTIKEDIFVITDAAGYVINPDDGSIQRWTLTASRTPGAAHANWTDGKSVTLFIADGTAYTITWTTLGVVWKGGTAPTLATSGYTEVNITKENGVLRGVVIGDFAS